MVDLEASIPCPNVRWSSAHWPCPREPGKLLWECQRDIKHLLDSGETHPLFEGLIHNRCPRSPLSADFTVLWIIWSEPQVARTSAQQMGRLHVPLVLCRSKLYGLRALRPFSFLAYRTGSWFLHRLDTRYPPMRVMGGNSAKAKFFPSNWGP